MACFTDFARVAQLDRVPGYEPGGRRFDSSHAHHNKKALHQCRAFFLLTFHCLSHLTAAALSHKIWFSHLYSLITHVMFNHLFHQFVKPIKCEWFLSLNYEFVNFKVNIVILLMIHQVIIIFFVFYWFCLIGSLYFGKTNLQKDSIVGVNCLYFVTGF